jgi:hypothetical protein
VTTSFDATTDYYALLGVASTASIAEIKTAYRQAALRAHPDRGGTHEWMIAVAAAWEVLSNPALRAAYNQARHQAADTRAAQEWHEAEREARARAEAYPRSWAEFDAWLNHATAEVQAYPLGRFLAGMVAGLGVGAVIGTFVGSVMGVGMIGGASVGTLAGGVVGGVIGRKQSELR